MVSIILIGSVLYPRKYIVPVIGECTIPETWDVFDLFEKIYNEGINRGIEKGMDKKAKEIRDCLNIKTDSSNTILI